MLQICKDATNWKNLHNRNLIQISKDVANSRMLQIEICYKLIEICSKLVVIPVPQINDICSRKYGGDRLFKPIMLGIQLEAPGQKVLFAREKMSHMPFRDSRPITISWVTNMKSFAVLPLKRRTCITF